MTRQEIIERLKGICANSKWDWIEIDDIHETTDIYHDLDFDSLDMVEFIMDIEKDFDIQITDEDCETMSTVVDVIDYLERVLVE